MTKTSGQWLGRLDPWGLVRGGMGGLRANWRTVGIGLAVLAVAGAGWAGYGWHQAVTEQEAHRALIQAYAQIRKLPADSPDLRGSVVKELRRVADSYRGTSSGGEARIRAGNELLHQEKWDEAIEAFTLYLKDRPKGPLALQAALGKAYAEEVKGTPDIAAKTLREALERSPNDPLAGEGHMTLARLSEQLQKSDEARRIYGMVIEKYPQTQWAQNAMEQMKELGGKK